jgi:hypothetical protein
MVQEGDMRYLVFVFTVLLVVMAASGAFAALDGPAWPPPGGAAFTASGDAGKSGGMTFELTNFDPAAYISLYWGPDSTQIIGLSFNRTDGATIFTGDEIMAYQSGLSDLTTGTAVWAGNTVMGYRDSIGNWHYTTVYSRFTLTVTDLSNTAMPLVDAASVGAPTSANVVTKISDPTGFKANLLWTASLNNTTWTPAVTLFSSSPYDNHGTGDYTHCDTTFNGGFYSSPVPEPSSLVVIITGLGALVGLRKRKLWQ